MPNNKSDNTAEITVFRQLRNVYFLSQILNAKAIWRGQSVGKLSDTVIIENGRFPIVTHFLISRPFGRPALLIPIEKIHSMDAQQILIDADDLKDFEEGLKPNMILLKDHVLDKKVLDIEDREVEIVYDVKMTLTNDKLYVTDVDLSKYGLLRRMGLKWLADLIYRPKKKDNEELVSWSYIQPLPTEISSFKGDIKLNILKERLHDLDPVDLADVLEELEPKQRAIIFNALETEHASDTLEEIDPNVQRQLVSSLKKEHVAKLINEMTPAQASDVLSALSADQAETFLPLLDKSKARKIRSILKKQDAKIIDLASSDFVQFRPEVTVAQMEEDYSKLCSGKDASRHYIYITDADGRLLGVADLKTLLLADDSLLLNNIMNDNLVCLHPDDTLKDAFILFKRYNFHALPIVDDQQKILGVVPYRDVMNLKHKFI